MHLLSCCGRCLSPLFGELLITETQPGHGAYLSQATTQSQEHPGLGRGARASSASRSVSLHYHHVHGTADADAYPEPQRDRRAWTSCTQALAFPESRSGWLCGSSQTHRGTSMPSGGGHIIRARCRRSAPAPPHRPTTFEARGTARPGSAWIRLQKAASRARKRRTLGCDRHDAAGRIEDHRLHDRRSGVDAWEECLHPGPPSHRGIRPAGPGTQRP